MTEFFILDGQASRIFPFRGKSELIAANMGLPMIQSVTVVSSARLPPKQVFSASDLLEAVRIVAAVQRVGFRVGIVIVENRNSASCQRRRQLRIPCLYASVPRTFETSGAKHHMPRQTSPIDARLVELRKELSSVTSALKQISEAIAALQQQIESEPAMAEDAEYVDRMTTEVGRQRIMTNRRAQVEAEIARLVASQEE